MKDRLFQRQRAYLALLFRVAAAISFIVVPYTAYTQDANGPQAKSAATIPTFGEADAVGVLADLRHAAESESPRRFLKPFDARKMPGFAAFRDQVAEFFEKYGPIRMNYRVTQVTTDGDFGAAFAEITLDGAPKESGASSLRMTLPVRVIFGWDGKAWKIVDWSPRDMFR